MLVFLTFWRWLEMGVLLTVYEAAQILYCFFQAQLLPFSIQGDLEYQWMTKTGTSSYCPNRQLFPVVEEMGQVRHIYPLFGASGGFCCRLSGWESSIEPRGLNITIGLKGSCCTIIETEVASSSWRLTILSLTFTLMFLMSLLVIKCFLETHWSNSCRFERSPTVSLTSVCFV